MLGALFGCVSFQTVMAGPFDIEKGMNIEALKKVCKAAPKHLGEDFYEISPIKTSHLLSTYVVRIDPTYGVYLLRAATKEIETNGYGDELRSYYQTLVESIAKSYGDYEETDFIKEDSWRKAPENFMYALSRGERTLFAAWTTEHKSRLPDEIESIAVVISAEYSSSGYVLLEYSFSNMPAVKEKADSVF